MSYYGPHWTFACSGCGGDYVDFPGTVSEREWDWDSAGEENA